MRNYWCNQDSIYIYIYIYSRIIFIIYFFLNIGINIHKLSMQMNKAYGVSPHNIIEQRATETENHVYETLDVVNEVSDINHSV